MDIVVVVVLFIYYLIALYVWTQAHALSVSVHFCLGYDSIVKIQFMVLNLLEMKISSWYLILILLASLCSASSLSLHLLLSTMLWCCFCWVPAPALNSKSATAAVNQWEKRTDEYSTFLYRPWAHHAGSVNNTFVWHCLYFSYSLSEKEHLFVTKPCFSYLQMFSFGDYPAWKGKPVKQKLCVCEHKNNDWVKKRMEYEIEGLRPRGRPKTT